jgi:hypothetical protein
MLKRPDEIAGVDDLALVRMTRGEVTAKLGRVFQLAQQCRKDVERRKRRLNRDDGGES